MMGIALQDNRSINPVGIIAGIVAFVLFYFLFSPAGLERPAQIVAAVGVMMAIWWVQRAFTVG